MQAGALDLDEGRHLWMGCEKFGHLFQRRDVNVAEAVVEPGALGGLNLQKICCIQFEHRFGPSGGPDQRVIVNHHRDFIGRELDVELDVVQSQVDGRAQRGDGVFRKFPCIASMSHELRHALRRGDRVGAATGVLTGVAVGS